MTTIRAVDEVFIPASPQRVWSVVSDIRRYPTWWPASLRLTILSCPEVLQGAEVEIAPSGGAPFKCRVTKVEPPTQMVMEYFGGLVSGTGAWTLKPADGGTLVTYRLDAVGHGWMVKILGLFMNLGAVHSRLMKGVLENLRSRVGI